MLFLYVTMIILRNHVCPDIYNIKDIILGWYTVYWEEYEVVPTKFEVDMMIRYNFKRYDVWHELTLPLTFHSESQLMQAISSDSLDQYWLNIKPEGCFTVEGAITSSDARCAICLESSGPKIQLENCNCLFHRKCIETSVQYKKSCPTCQSTINMYSISINAKKEKTQRVNIV